MYLLWASEIKELTYCAKQSIGRTILTPMMNNWELDAFWNTVLPWIRSYWYTMNQNLYINSCQHLCSWQLRAAKQSFRLWWSPSHSDIELNLAIYFKSSLWKPPFGKTLKLLTLETLMAVNYSSVWEKKLEMDSTKKSP